MLKIYDEPESTNEGTSLRHTTTGIAKGGGASKLYDEPEWPNEGARLRYMIHREGGLKIYEEPESPNEEAWLKSMMNRNRQMRGCV